MYIHAVWNSQHGHRILNLPCLVSPLRSIQRHTATGVLRNSEPSLSRLIPFPSLFPLPSSFVRYHVIYCIQRPTASSVYSAGFEVVGAKCLRRYEVEFEPGQVELVVPACDLPHCSRAGMLMIGYCLLMAQQCVFQLVRRSNGKTSPLLRGSSLFISFL